MTKRNFGFPEPGGQRYPNGCDWPKPPGCDCKFIAQAQGCENRCDDSMYEIDRYAETGFWWMLAKVVLVCVVLFALVALFTTKAHCTNLPVPPPLPRHAPVVELPPVVVDAPAPAPKLPFYCRALTRFERNCTGVKLAAASLGAKHAETLARKCGATEEELAQARACLDPKR